MAEPKTQIERRQDNLEKAIREMGKSILSDVEQAQIDRILRGEDLGETEADDAGSET